MIDFYFAITSWNNKWWMKMAQLPLSSPICVFKSVELLYFCIYFCNISNCSNWNDFLSFIPSHLIWLKYLFLLLFRHLLLLAAGSAGRWDTSAGLCPFGEGTVSHITSWLPDSCQDRVKIICCHDDCVLPAGVWQSWSQTPQRCQRNAYGLNSCKH